MRSMHLVLAAVAVLLVASAVTAGITIREAKASDSRCANSDSQRCATTSDCNPERPACQEQLRSERLRRYCAENPRDAKCR